MAAAIFWVVGIAIAATTICVPIYSFYKNNKLREKRLLNPSPQITDALLRDFHKTEFVALKAEIAEGVKTHAANFQYSVGASGVVFALMFTTSRPLQEGTATFGTSFNAYYAALWLPLIVTWLFFLFSIAVYIRIGEIGSYLERLENLLGSTYLGWEKTFKEHPSTFGPLYFLGWMLLFAIDFCVPHFLHF